MIHQARMIVTVLFDDGDVRPEWFRRTSLNSIERLIQTDGIGSVEVESIKPVDPDKVHQALLEMGNDGTFFDDFGEFEPPERSEGSGKSEDIDAADPGT